MSIGPRPRWHFRFAEVFNGSTFLQFLKQIVRQYDTTKIFMVLDNVSYHHSRTVREWVDEHRNRIELFYLPPYSPELNAAENVWRATKRATTHNRHFPTFAGLRLKVLRRFSRYQCRPNQLRGPIRQWLSRGTRSC